jgi:hypothetical protein
MLGKFKKQAVMVAGIALAAGGLSVGGAQAHPDGTNFTCTIDAQTATVHNDTHDPGGKVGDTGPGKGLYYPVNDPHTAHTLDGGDKFSWTFNGDCAENGAKFTSSGTGKGWCGRSVSTGTGTIASTPTSAAHTFTVNWESVGTQLILTHPTARGSVNANPLATLGQGSCTDGSATKFVVTGTITHSFPS